MRKVSSLQDVQLVLNDVNNRLDSLTSDTQNLHGRQIKNAGNATDPQDYVTLSQLNNLNFATINGKVQAHQVQSVAATSITGNIKATVGLFNSLTTQQLAVTGTVIFNNSNIFLQGGNLAILHGGALQVDNTISAFSGISLFPKNIQGNFMILINYPTIPFGFPFLSNVTPNPWIFLDLAGMHLPTGFGSITGDAIFMTGGVQGAIQSEIGGSLIIYPTVVQTNPSLIVGTIGGPWGGVRYNAGLQWSNDNIAWNNFSVDSAYAENGSIVALSTASYTNVVSVTVPSTGTYFVGYQLQSSVSVLNSGDFGGLLSRLTRNGSPISGGPNSFNELILKSSAAGTVGDFICDRTIKIALTNGDTIALQGALSNTNNTGSAQSGCNVYCWKIGP